MGFYHTYFQYTMYIQYIEGIQRQFQRSYNIYLFYSSLYLLLEELVTKMIKRQAACQSGEFRQSNKQVTWPGLGSEHTLAFQRVLNLQFLVKDDIPTKRHTPAVAG